VIVGCHGGVGTAVLSLLEHSDPGRELRQRLDAVLLVDRRPRPGPVALKEGFLLPPTRIASGNDLSRLIREHRITRVVDLSSVDTLDCTRACDEWGSDFLCTSVEEWPGQSPVPTYEAIARLIPPRRPALVRRSHLVGSGANPGIVNALVFAAMERFADLVGVSPTVRALDLHSVLITEQDTTVEAGYSKSSAVFPMTWSPLHCLEELFEENAFAARGGKTASLGHGPTAELYRARCYDRHILGMAVPHEEIATLARLFPSVEIAFLYRLPPAARRALAAHPDRLVAEAWSTHRLYPPWAQALTGQDRVGVLLCSRRFGELWLGFVTDMAAGLRLGTNATQLQVAAGVLAGWSQLGRRKGIHFVEDLDWREYLNVVSSVLGPPVMIHDAGAPAMWLADRLELTGREFEPTAYRIVPRSKEVATVK
jgi:homospermidine synthase